MRLNAEEKKLVAEALLRAAGHYQAVGERATHLAADHRLAMLDKAKAMKALAAKAGATQ